MAEAQIRFSPMGGESLGAVSEDGSQITLDANHPFVERVALAHGTEAVVLLGTILNLQNAFNYGAPEVAGKTMVEMLSHILRDLVSSGAWGKEGDGPLLSFSDN